MATALQFLRIQDFPEEWSAIFPMNYIESRSENILPQGGVCLWKPPPLGILDPPHLLMVDTHLYFLPEQDSLALTQRGNTYHAPPHHYHVGPDLDWRREGRGRDTWFGCPPSQDIPCGGEG